MSTAKAAKSVSEKMGIKEGVRALLVNAPEDAVQAIDLPDINMSNKQGKELDYIHLFVKTQSGFNKQFPVLKAKLKQGGMLWVSWPKGGQLGTDLNIKNIIQMGYSFGLVESTCLSINSTWSGLKFTHPKKGKVYNNSYGELPV